ncbi:MAG TPA: tyrosine-protein phosphatase [Tepidisphaeraceae bacterium]|nr:tyrosine-protein phosphatase [Tepidisphaeraceae bacterium]
MMGRIQNSEFRIRKGGLRCALVVLVIVCAGCAGRHGEEAPGVKNFGEVTPEIWRGGKPTHQGMRWLAERGAKTIIDLQMEDESRDVPEGVGYVPIRCSLWQCDEVDVEAVLKVIEESPKPVFIHCLQGRDRTGLAVAAWRMRQGISAQDAMAEMERFGTNPWWDRAIRARIRRLSEEMAAARAAKRPIAESGGNGR